MKMFPVIVNLHSANEMLECEITAVFIACTFVNRSPSHAKQQTYNVS